MGEPSVAKQAPDGKLANEGPGRFKRP